MFLPVADSYVQESNPTTNYGTSTALGTGTSPIVKSYLRFNVNGLNTTIKRATLRMFASTGSNDGYFVNRLENNTWGELTINYNNAPLPGGQLGSSGSVSTDAWTKVDVTSYIDGNGTFSLVLTGAGSTQLSLASRESGAHAPQLVIETGGQQPYRIATLTSAWKQTRTATPTATPTQTATSTRSPSSTPTRTSHLTSFVPAADSYVNESNTTMNYGMVTNLRVDGSPIIRSYLRFDVQGLSGTITRVTLRLFTNTSSGAGYEVHSVTDNTWNELTINHTNAPAMDGITATSGPFGASAWTTVDMTPLVTGNGSYNLALTTTGGTAFSLASREAGANAPQLVIETTP